MQLLNPKLATNHVVSLTEILTCRDARQSRQNQWLKTYLSTLVSITIVAPGPIKDSELTRQAFNLAICALQKTLRNEKWPVTATEIFDLPTGAEALIALNIPAEQVKQKMVELEQTHKVGRLWDIDVIDSQGNILSRSDSGLAVRRCLVCDNDAKICGRTRAHSFAELTNAMIKLVQNELNSSPIHQKNNETPN